MNDKHRLLVLLDGSERALDAVRYIASMKNMASMSVVVLYNVYAHLPQGYLDMERQPETHEGKTRIDAWQILQETGRMQYMKRAEKMLKDGGIANVEIQVRKTVRGVARDILAEIHEEYLAVVMTKRGMGLLAGLPLGSVANKLLQNISVTPVILVAEGAQPKRVMIGVDGSDDSMRAVSFAGTILGEGHAIGLVHAIRNTPDPDFIMPQTDIEHIKTDMEATFRKMREELIKKGIPAENISQEIIEGESSRAGALLLAAGRNGYGTIVIGRKGLSRTREFSMGRVSTKIIQMSCNHAVWLV